MDSQLEKTKQFSKESVPVYEGITLLQHASPSQLSEVTGLSRQQVQHHLKKLLALEVIEKIGKTPHVYYQVVEGQSIQTDVSLGRHEKTINQNFMYVSSSGKSFEGKDGFVRWCKERKLDIQKTAKRYSFLLSTVSKKKRKGRYSIKTKFKETFEDDLQINYVYFFEPYAIEVFGKTKLAQKVLRAKENETFDSVIEAVHEIKDRVNEFIKNGDYDAICVVPHTITREYQFLDYVKKSIDTNKTFIKITRIFPDQKKSQKSLKKLSERVTNAHDTIFINDLRKFKNILIIDDAIGSGATINETARKIRIKNLEKGGKITGLGIVGSLKGFDVISGI